MIILPGKKRVQPVNVRIPICGVFRAWTAEEAVRQIGKCRMGCGAFEKFPIHWSDLRAVLVPA
jgi:hypothetical protein